MEINLNNRNLPTIYVITKTNDIFTYAVENGINLEEINNYIKQIYGDNFKELKLGTTVGYLTKKDNIK